VYQDVNLNGMLDFGEPGVAGVSVTVTGTPGGTQSTNARGVYGLINTIAGPGSVTVNVATLPSGWVLTDPPVRTFDLGNCRSAQELNFAAKDTQTGVKQSTFGRLKMLYR
jgi:hypothetical protein